MKKPTRSRPRRNNANPGILVGRANQSRLKHLMALKNKLSKDPAQVFVPNEIQANYLESKARCRMLHGKNQGGKSTVCAIEMRYYLTCSHPHRKTWPNARFFCLVPSKEQAKLIYGQYLLKESEITGTAEDQPILNMDRTEVDYAMGNDGRKNVPKVIRDTKTGCTLEFFWSDWSGTIKRIRGTRFAGGWVDEDGGTVALMNEMHPRLAKAIDRYPGGGFITWVVTECGINQAQEEFLSNCMDESEDYADWVEWSMKEGMKGDPVSEHARAETAKAMSDREAKIRMTGTASAAEYVRIFPYMKDRNKYIMDKAYEPTERDNIYVSIDQGMDHPTGIAIGHSNALKPKQLVVTYCVELIGQPLGTICREIIDYLCGRRMRMLIYDKHHNKRDWECRTFADQLAELLKDPELWVEVGNSHGPWLCDVDQDHISSIATMHTFLQPPEQVHPEPMLLFDRPNATNGILHAYGQIERLRGRQDADYEGPQGIYKKGVGDDLFDAVRNLASGFMSWNDYGINLPNAAFVPSKYEIQQGKVKELSDEDKARIAKELNMKQMLQMIKKGENPVFGGSMPSIHELDLLKGNP